MQLNSGQVRANMHWAWMLMSVEPRRFESGAWGVPCGHLPACVVNIGVDTALMPLLLLLQVHPLASAMPAQMRSVCHMH